MKQDELKKTQAPLKEKYAVDPRAAIITLKAHGILGENVSCKIDTGRAMHEAGLHPATGGSGMQLCSGDMLLEALVACAGVTLNAVATAKGIEIRNGKIFAEGDIDFRGTLGISRDVPVGFTAIRLKFDLDTSADKDQLDILFKLTERYCVVYQTLTRGIAVETNYNVKVNK